MFKELNTADKVGKLVEVATGERYGDGMTVTNVLVGFAEPGYGPDDAVVVLGDWNTKRYVRDGEPPLTKAESMPARLGRALEAAGAELVWLDEWTECDECYRAMRTQPDSYGWQMHGAFTGEGYTCADCMARDVESYLSDDSWDGENAYLNNPRRAITWCGRADLEAVGFVKWEPGNEQTFENGWHPGQTDEPEPIMEAIRERHPSADVVFFIDGVGMFDVHFSAFVRFKDDLDPDLD